MAGFPSALVTGPSLKAQMELLQQAPPSGHRANGSLEVDLPITRRRRGRRKNVEGLELLFMGNKRAVRMRRRDRTAETWSRRRRPALNSPFVPQEDADGAKASSAEGVRDAARALGPLAVAEPSPGSRSLASGSLEEEEGAATNKELGEWLRQHPTYTMDMAGFTQVRSTHPDGPLHATVTHLSPSLSLSLPSPLHRRARTSCLSSPSPSRSVIAAGTPTRSTSTR